VAYALQAGWSVIDLYADDANKDRIIAELKKVRFGSLLGHGNKGVFTGQRQQVVFQVGDQATLEFCQQAGETTLNFLSCLMGQQLAPWMCQNGLGAAKAYTEEFVFANDPSDFPDSVAEPFFLSYCEFDRVFLSTMDPDQAYQAELRMWEAQIDKADPRIKPYLVQDYDSSELFKKGEQPPQPKPCPFSKAVVKLPGGRRLLRWYRGWRFRHFGVQPGAFPEA